MTPTFLYPHPPANPMLLRGLKIPDWIGTIAAKDLLFWTSQAVVPCPWCLFRNSSEMM